MRRAPPKHLTAQQIAELELEGLPSTKRGINKRARAEQWRFTDRGGRGGGRFYMVVDLPPEALDDLQTRYRQKTIGGARPSKRGRPSGQNWFTARPEISDAVTAWRAQREVSANVILELIRSNFNESPALRTLQRFISALEYDNELALQSFRDPNAFKGTRRLSLGRADADVTYIGQRWELDTTPGDVLLVEGRRAILAALDVFSRRVRFLVMPSESAQSVRRLLSSTMEHWGICPSEIVIDCGSGYLNSAICSAMEMLDINLRPCTPGSPEKKPHVERVFGTFQRARSEVLAGYCGHNVAEAQRLRERARKETGKPLIVPEMTAAELQAVLDNWADGPYWQTRHSGLGMSPLAKWQSSPPAARSAPNADELRIVLSAYVGTRTVGKRGIEWKRGRYWSPALVDYMGREVMVRRDEDELGELMIFDDAGQFICHAVNHQRSGMSEEQFALAARRDQDAHMKHARAGLRDKMRRFTIEDARDKLLRHDAEMAGKLVTLPAPYSAPQSAAQSATIHSIRNRPEPATLSPAQFAAAEKRAKARPQSNNASPLSLEQKIAEADALIAAASRGEEVDSQRLRWAQAYVQNSEYRTAKVMAAQFGTPLSAPPQTGPKTELAAERNSFERRG